MSAVAGVKQPALTCTNLSPASTDYPGALYWGSSGRRFKSCQPDTGQRRFSALTAAGFWPVDRFADHIRFRHSTDSKHAVMSAL